jgi:hypothetical protein
MVNLLPASLGERNGQKSYLRDYNIAWFEPENVRDVFVELEIVVVLFGLP